MISQDPDIDTKNLIGGKRKNGHKIDCKCHICENMTAKAKRHGYEEDLEKEQERKMGGPQKKNGHKKKCVCPICNNMKNMSKSKSVVKGKKSNGHKPDCGCPICKNMKKKLNGGNHLTDTLLDEVKKDAEHKFEGNKKGGTKKSNGHKADCGCPICKNMKKTRKNKKLKRTKRRY